jgi:MFS family permease
LKESPVFQAMKAAGEVAKNPIRESFSSWANVKLVLVALFGIAAGLTVIWYTAQFQAMYFLQNALRIEDSAARAMIGAAALVSVFWFILFGWLSDRIGRRKPILIGYSLTILLMFPLFHWMAAAANPALSQAMARSPVVVSGSDCEYHPFATVQPTACGKLLDTLSKKGIAYKTTRGNPGALPVVTVGGAALDPGPDGLDRSLAAAGYKLEKTRPTLPQALQVVLAIVVIGLCSGMTFGPVAALLTELFPARIRYTSMSVPYHIGTGYFGGFLPFISQYIVARTGDPFAGLWYTIAVAGMALVVTALWLPETAGKELE